MRCPFTPDTQPVLNQKGNVEFLIGLHRDINPDTARSKLELLTKEIGYANYIPVARTLVCTTSQAAYETIFLAELEKCSAEERRIGLKYTEAGYRELKPATVPETLRTEIKSVHLNLLNKR